MKTVLKYPGGKSRVSNWIINHFPKHDVYLEPFFGGGSVFFDKEPSHIETLNDLNGEVYNFFKVLRENGNELANQIKLTPYCRDEYTKSYRTESGISDIEKARRFFVRCWQGFGCSNRYRNGFRSGQQAASPSCANDWNKLPEVIIEAAKRIKMAQIENLPAEELLRRYDTKDVFIYCDPPYLPGTRKGYLYECEMSKEEHIQLLNLLKQHKGKVIISGYDNDLYNQFLSDWNTDFKQTTAECGVKRTEKIWMNYEVNRQYTLFDN